jgi:glutathione synthase/RimK-type ligase-like ATP-grasp enzyme
MKKIGILFGMEETYSKVFIDTVNSKNEKRILAEAVSIEKVIQNKNEEYAVLIDRLAQDVFFYHAYLKNAVSTGTNVINNPFWWSADDKLFNNGLADTLGIPVSNTILFPSRKPPTDSSSKSFRNLSFQ